MKKKKMRMEMSGGDQMPKKALSAKKRKGKKMANKAMMMTKKAMTAMMR